MKIRGPFFSAGASGQIFKAIVMFPWKGKTIARELVKPSQPRTAPAMNVRIKLKALGKVNKAFTESATLEVSIREKSPSGIPWNAAWIGYAIHEFQKDNDDYDTLAGDFNTSTACAQWSTEAGLLGLQDQTLTVEGKSPDHPVTYMKGVALYSIAKACWFMEVKDAVGVAYTDPHDWDIAAVTAFKGRIVD